MKKLKLEHKLAEAVLKGTKRTTWRLFDDKDLSLNDQVVLVDKVDPQDHSSWKNIGIATITQVIEKRLADITDNELKEYGFTSQEHMLSTFQKYYGPEVGVDIPVKIINFSFSESLPSDNKVPSIQAEKVIIYSDGGSRGNPGPSACAYVIADEANTVLISHGTYLGITTNNQAEYMGLKLALEQAKVIGAQEVTIYMDSMLVVNQMRGIFKVKNRDLWPIHDSIMKLRKHFKHFSITQVPREFNKAADRLVNQTLDQQLFATKPV